MFNFTIKKNIDKARVGIIKTPHGDVHTPAFIFCATKAAMKAVSPDQMKQAGTQIILSNTYHLMLQPGSELVAKNGGLQKFTGWRGPMLTDSGGFQIFSLGHGSVVSEIKGAGLTNRNKTLLKITEEGAIFKSYLNGDIIHLTPEKSIQIQHQLGADLIVVLDECTPYHADYLYTKKSMEMSHRWAIRCLQELGNLQNGNYNQKLYNVIQGGIHPDLRKISCDFSNNNNFFGTAVGGSLGAEKSQMYDVVSLVMENLRKDRPVHLLGIGGIKDIFVGVENGVDTFDCVHPSRLARHGGALVKPNSNISNKKEHINLRNHFYQDDLTPIEHDCGCYTCKNFTRSYLNHLLKAKEILAFTLLTIHNVYFMNHLMSAIRQAIINDCWQQTKKEWLA